MHASPMAVVPPASVPLSFLAAGGVGLVAFGAATALAADKVVVTPTHPGVASAAHVGVLAFLSVSVLGALHQFGPVVGRRALRSVAAARVTFVGIVATAWLLPSGLAHGPEWLIPTGGLIGLATVCLASWNLSRPLASTDAGLPGRGLQLSVGFLVVTVCFGVVYAFNRQTGWFPLLHHRLLAHVHLGLLGWLGLTYISVAEKLWPMFLLAHRPSSRSGAVAVWSVAGGTALVAPGLLFAVPALAFAGGLVVGVGLVAHLTSLASSIRHRRRSLELLHVYLVTSAAFLVTAVICAGAAALLDVSSATRVRLVTAEVVSLIAWLALAVVGHAHKIVPFIGYSALRSRGVQKGPLGRPLLFGDLYRPLPARFTWLSLAAGMSAVLAGVLSATSTPVTFGGVGVAAAGLVATVNLASGPRRVLRLAKQGFEPATAASTPPSSNEPLEEART